MWRCGGFDPDTGVSWHVHNVLIAASTNMPKKNVPAPSALASTNFSTEPVSGRTLYTNGLLALPTNKIPLGATVKLSGCDLASAMTISAADAMNTEAANETNDRA